MGDSRSSAIIGHFCTDIRILSWKWRNTEKRKNAITVYDGYTSNIKYFRFDACFDKKVTW